MKRGKTLPRTETARRKCDMIFPAAECFRPSVREGRPPFFKLMLFFQEPPRLFQTAGAFFFVSARFAPWGDCAPQKAFLSFRRHRGFCRVKQGLCLPRPAPGEGRGFRGFPGEEGPGQRAFVRSFPALSRQRETPSAISLALRAPAAARGSCGSAETSGDRTILNFKGGHFLWLKQKRGLF